MRDGASFSLLENGQPFIAFYLSHMTEEEIAHIGGWRIESAYWSSGGFWLGVLKIGKMMQQLAFNPMVHLFNYKRFSSDLFQENRLVTFVGIDSVDMTVKVLRAATYPWKFLVSLEEAFRGFSPHDDYSRVYDRIINGFNYLPLMHLWGKFTPGGYFGEKRAEG